MVKEKNNNETAPPRCSYCKSLVEKDKLHNCEHCGKMFCLYHIRQDKHRCEKIDWEFKKQERHAESERKFEEYKKYVHSKAKFRMLGRILIVIIILSMAFYFYQSMVNTCDGNVAQNTCSKDKPYYCVNKTLIENPDKCGCQDGFAFYNNTCVPLN
jgi:hypothetical protein